jgi:hypothetical protein
MTLTEAITYVKNLHNEGNAVQSNWSDSELYQLFYAKSQEAVSVLGLIEGTTTSTSTAGTEAYSYPSNYIRLRRVRYNGQGLKYIPFRNYETRASSGVAPSGTPREWSAWNNTIYLLPTPTVSADTITFFGEKQQSAITSSSSTLDIPEVFHPALCDAVIAEMFAKDLNTAMMNFYSNKWLSFHIPAMKEFAKRRRRVAGPITVADAESNLETDWGVI